MQLNDMLVRCSRHKEAWLYRSCVRQGTQQAAQLKLERQKREDIKQSALYTGRRILLCITSVCLKEAGKETWDQDTDAKSLLVSFVALLCISSMGHLRDDITASVGFCSKSC